MMTSSNELLASQKMLALLEQANSNVEEILDGFPSVFGIINAQYFVIRANAAFCDLLQLSMDEILHQSFIEMFHIENQKILEHHLIELSEGTQANPKEVQFRADITPPHSQEPQQFLWSIAPLKTSSPAEGQLYAVVGKDCSSIYASEAKLSGIFESLPLAILMIDADGYIDEVLSRYSEVLLENNALAGKRLYEAVDLASDKDAEDLAMTFKRMAGCAGKPVSDFTALDPYYLKSFAIKRRNTFNQKWIKASYQAIPVNNVIQKFLVILQDDTNSVKMANERKRIHDLERQSRELYECAVRDPLTGLYTRLYMNDGFNTLLNGFKYGHISAIELIIFDIDDFKSINDTYGHAAGDKAITAVGQVILEHSNTGAVAVRYGGDEFLVMLPEDHGQNRLGYSFANTVREKIETIGAQTPSGAAMPITLSAGVISCRKDETIEALIERVDSYLYKAKDAGKNTVFSETHLIEGQ